MRELLTVGELAARSGVPISTIHFYEAKGLISSVRSSANHRLFARTELRRVAVVKVAQRAGISLKEIQEMLARLPTSRAVSRKDWGRLSKLWTGRLEERIARLTALRDELSGCIGCGCLSLDVCPMWNPMDRLGNQGSGPRLLPFEV